MRYFLRVTLGITMGLFAATVPGYSTPIMLSLGTTVTSGTITIDGTGAGETLASIANVQYSTLLVSGAPSDDGFFTGLNALLSYSVSGGVGTLTLTAGTGGLEATGAFSNIVAGTVLLKETMAPIAYTSSQTPPAGTFTTSGLTSGSTVNVEFANSTSLVESAVFLGDLGTAYNIGVNTMGGISAGTETGTTGSGSSEVTTFNASSETLAATLVPEPVSFLMLGSGLLALAFFGRKRLARN